MILAASIACAILAPKASFTTAVLVRISGNPKFAGLAKEEAYGKLRDTVRAVVRKEIIEYGYSPADMDTPPEVTNPLAEFESKFDPRKAKDKANWAKIAKTADVNTILLVDVTGWNIRNTEPGALASNPKLPGSVTRASVKMYWYDDSSGLLTTPTDKPFEGTANGGYFGTSDPSDMQGSPDAKAFEIKNNNRKRMEQIAKATWEAIRFQIPKL
jgi:hypothetical protein